MSKEYVMEEYIRLPETKKFKLDMQFVIEERKGFQVNSTARYDSLTQTELNKRMHDFLIQYANGKCHSLQIIIVELNG